MKPSILTVAFALVLLPLSAQAAPIFSDNFNGENGGVGQLNYGGFANFAISSGTVDLIGNGFFDFLTGNGLYVDLDGSTGDAGLMSANPLALGPGNYVLSFDLAGSQRGTTELVTINVFGALSASYGSLLVAKLGSDPFATVFLPFTLLTGDSIRFSFSNAGGDNVGALLDNVALNATAVPEPTTLLLMGSGIGLLSRRFRRRGARLD